MSVFSAETMREVKRVRQRVWCRRRVGTEPDPADVAFLDAYFAAHQTAAKARRARRLAAAAAEISAFVPAPLHPMVARMREQAGYA